MAYPLRAWGLLEAAIFTVTGLPVAVLPVHSTVGCAAEQNRQTTVAAAKVEAPSRTSAPKVPATTGRQVAGAPTSAGGVVRAREVTPAQALGFEREGAWLSVPPDLLDHMEENGIPASQLACARVLKYKSGDPVQPGFTLAARAAGVQLSRDHVVSGSFSGKWVNHPLYPSIVCDRVAGERT